MSTYRVNCEQCGKEFEAVRRGKQKPPRFCSLGCYWASGKPALNAKRKPHTGKARYARVYTGRDEEGRPRYIQRSHHVWNQHHPDDPILPGEYIHHVDHNRFNDAPANLRKLRAGEHQSYHAKRITSEERSRRMQEYYAANPGTQRRGQTKICPICGTEFYRPPSAKAQTCSYKCMGKLQTLRRRSG